MGLRSKIFRYAMSGGFSSSAKMSRSAKGFGTIRSKSGKSLFDTKLSKLFSNTVDQRFDEDLWEGYYYDIIEAQQDKAGNAGQETLLSDEYFGGDAKQYCRINGKNYEPEEFISYVKNNLGDDYYYAINIIIEECAIELYEAWDRSFSNDGIGDKLFGGDMGSNRRVYGSFSNALAVYSAAAAKRGYDLSGSAAGNAKNRELNRQSLIKRFGTGPTKAWNTSNYYGSASYVNAAKKNGKNL